mgnify:CR=1 FL=1
MNQVALVGNLTRDVELRKTQSGKSVVSFTVAVQKKFNREEADFVNCVAWEHTADFISNYLVKGSKVSVEGSIQSRSYEDSNGKKVFVQEVLAERVQSLESRQQREEASVYQGNNEPNEENTLDITSDDLPFN